MMLVGLMDEAAITPLVERQHLGGDGAGRDGMALSDATARERAL